MDNQLFLFWVHLSLYELQQRAHEQDIILSKLLSNNQNESGRNPYVNQVSVQSFRNIHINAPKKGFKPH